MDSGITKRRFSEQTHPELLAPGDVIDDVISGVVGDVLDQERPRAVLPRHGGQLHPEVRHVLVGVDIPAQAHTRVIPGQGTGLNFMSDFNLVLSRL